VVLTEYRLQHSMNTQCVLIVIRCTTYAVVSSTPASCDSLCKAKTLPIVTSCIKAQMVKYRMYCLCQGCLVSCTHKCSYDGL